MDTKIRALLTLGEKPRYIAEKLGTGYQKVLKIRKDMEAEKANATVDEAVKLDPVALELIVKAASKSPEHSKIIRL